MLPIRIYTKNLYSSTCLRSVRIKARARINSSLNSFSANKRYVLEKNRESQDIETREGDGELKIVSSFSRDFGQCDGNLNEADASNGA